MIVRSIVAGEFVQHRAWHWIAKVIEVPEGVLNHSTTVKVELPDGSTQTHALFSLIPDEKDFIYDWSEFDESPKRRAKSKSKKPRSKR